MSVNQEDLADSLAELLGGRQSSEEGLNYARRILDQSLESPGIDRTGVEELREQEEGVLGALKQARARLMEQRGPSRGQMLLAISAGLGAPTRTGAIGETAGNVSRNLLPIAQQKTAFETGRDEALSSLDLAEAQIHGPSTQAEIDIDKLEYQQRQQNMREALKTISKGGVGSSRSLLLREVKIQDNMRLWNIDRKWATAKHDKLVTVEILDNGKARLINNAMQPPGVMVIPLSELPDYLVEEIQNGEHDEPYEPPDTGSAYPDEVDMRTQQEKDVGLYVTQAFIKGASMWDMAALGSGPVPSVLAALSIPSSVVGGPVAFKTLVAQQGLKIRSMTLAKQLVENPRMPVRLVEMAMAAAGLEPGFFETGPIMQAKMVSLDQFLYAKYLEQSSYSNDIDIPEELQSSGAHNAQVIGMFLRDMGVPPRFQRRSIFVSTDNRGDSDLPDLPESVPSGIPQSTWNRLTKYEKTRWYELNTQLKIVQETEQ